MSDPAASTSSRPHPHPGFFLALEGPDGSGKSTQATRLAHWFRDLGLSIYILCHDPGGTEVGKRLREILLSRDTTDLSLRSEMLIYMASRAQLVDQIIRPAMTSGKVVISDRFLLSNIVYQGYAGGLDVDEIWQVGRMATGGLLPDLTLVLDVPTATTRNRIGPGRDRIEDRPPEYQERVRAGFLDAVRRADEEGRCPYYPAPLALIDATGEPDAVFGLIRSEVERVLALGPRR